MSCKTHWVGLVESAAEADFAWGIFREAWAVAEGLDPDALTETEEQAAASAFNLGPEPREV